QQSRVALERFMLKASTEWRQTFDAVDFPILVVDVNGAITRLNRAARDVAGLPYEEQIGKTFHQLSSDEPWRTAGELVRAACLTRTRASRQVRDERRDRIWDIAATSFIAKDEEGEELRLIVVARDVTAMLKMQDSLRQSERMSAMGALVAGVA